jgi:hypothetical protein
MVAVELLRITAQITVVVQVVIRKQLFQLQLRVIS